MFFFSWSADHRDLPSFPTRRSSDLRRQDGRACARRQAPGGDGVPEALQQHVRREREEPPGGSRSEEHTSELQSHSDLVCRLLLEKKNKQQKAKRDQSEEYKQQRQSK